MSSSFTKCPSFTLTSRPIDIFTPLPPFFELFSICFLIFACLSLYSLTASLIASYSTFSIYSAFEPGEEVFKKLDRLNPEVRTVIILYYFEELTLKEIADVTQTNLNTVKSRMYSGLRKLKGIIKEDSD